MNRRHILKAGLVLLSTATAAAVFRPIGAAARVLTGGTNWIAKDTAPPEPVDATRRVFLTDAEVTQVTAVFDRLIPADALSPSASALGCVTFLDHQLGGAYGRGDWMYTSGPLQPGLPEQGEQLTPLAPAEVYRTGLAEMDAHCRASLGKPFAELTPEAQDDYLEQMEAGRHAYPTIAAQRLFALMLANVLEGFFADPIYGGNKDMAGWKMIGFPGARYDYRDVAAQKGKPLNIAPVSLAGRI